MSVPVSQRHPSEWEKLSLIEWHLQLCNCIFLPKPNHPLKSICEETRFNGVTGYPSIEAN